MSFDRLSSAEAQLDRTHGFFPRIDSKMSALLAIGSGEAALLAINLSPGDLLLWYIDVPGTVFVLLLIAVYWNLYQCASPHLKGGSQSIVYFKEIAKRTEANFIKDFGEISEADLLRDISAQIWRNSQIVDAKFDSLKIATTLLLTSALPWIVTLCAASLTHARLPLVGP